MLPGEAGINVRKTARYAGKDCDPLQIQKGYLNLMQHRLAPCCLVVIESGEAHQKTCIAQFRFYVCAFGLHSAPQRVQRSRYCCHSQHSLKMEFQVTNVSRK